MVSTQEGDFAISQRRRRKDIRKQGCITVETIIFMINPDRAFADKAAHFGMNKIENSFENPFASLRQLSAHRRLTGSDWFDHSNKRFLELMIDKLTYFLDS